MRIKCARTAGKAILFIAFCSVGYHPARAAPEVRAEVYGDATEAQRKLILDAAALIRKAVATPAFRSRVLNHNFNGRTHFRDKNGDVQKSNAEVLAIIDKGLERNTNADSEIDILVRLWSHPRGTVGSTTLGRQPVKTAYWFANRCVASNDAISMARHLMHEWLHVAGFYHYPDNSARGDVPYVVGGFIREVLNQDKALVPAGMVEDPVLVTLLDFVEDEVEGD
jgi:hypothetical protein